MVSVCYFIGYFYSILPLDENFVDVIIVHIIYCNVQYPENISLNYYKDHAMVVSLLKSETTDHEPSSKTNKVANETFDPHTTKWSDVNLFKFGVLITVSSTVENAIFYPYVSFVGLQLVLFCLFVLNI